LERTSAHVDQKEQATDDRQCLEEIVPGDAKESAKGNKKVALDTNLRKSRWG
jgi:hypothetical protein